MDTSVTKLCPNCHSAITLTTYPDPFCNALTRGYCNVSAHDATSITNALARPQRELGTLSAEINRVETLLGTLKTHHAHLTRHIQQTAAYAHTSSIRELPTEVLDIIFHLACDSSDRADFITALSISLVCSKWRDVAISTPEIWSHIYVAFDLKDVFYHYLKRSGDALLSIKFELPLDPYTTA